MTKKPRDPAAALRIAHQLFSTRQTSAAVRQLRELCKTYPDLPDALQLLGVACCEFGRIEEGLRHLERAAQRAPRSAAVLCNLGKAQFLAGHLPEALESYLAGLAIEPRTVPLICGCANVLIELGRRSEAIERYRRALSVDDACAEAHDNLGRQLMAEGRSEDAVRHLKRAAQLDPGHANTWFVLCDALLKLKDRAGARSALRRGVALNPTGGDELSRAMECALQLGQWDDYDKIRGRLIDVVSRDGSDAFPCTLLYISDDPALHLKCAKKVYRSPRAEKTDAPTLLARPKKEKIRVGYFSADFRAHPTSHLCVGLFERHDRSAFEVIGVSINKKHDGTALADRVRKSFDRFLDLSDESDADIRQAVSANGIDIAIDLMGHTQFARPALFNPRLAPVQLNFLGYPGTSGCPEMDYIILDPFIATQRVRDCCTERAVILPVCYQPNDDARAAPAPAGTRAEYGLPEGGFVFCCFNNPRKITPQVFDVWMSILKAREGSVLWLLGDADTADTGFRKEAKLRGIAPERIVFGAFVDQPAYLARYKVADLFLDTFPYTAHTTASDALGAGCPILTCTGESFASRVSGSLLSALGLPELITQRLEDYRATALRLSSDAAALSELRRKLEDRKKISQLFNTTRFAREFEEALFEMWKRNQAGVPPDTIDHTAPGGRR